ncbi:MAG: polysaccharide biosynthesis protein, partial [Clostridia bacterium]|nr:polysaccharide biosynthesis protein [Clostridia bacterium]
MQANPKKKRFHFEPWHRIAAILLFFDIFAVNLSYFIALWLRFDLKYSTIPERYLTEWLRLVPIYTVIVLVVFALMRLYRSLWRYASYAELWRTIAACAITSGLHALISRILFGRMPISYYIVGAGIQLVATVGIRFAYRFLLLMRSHHEGGSADEHGVSRVMIVGAGSAGQMIMRDIRRSKSIHDKVVCFIDDNSNKWNRYIEGVPIAGGRDDILASVGKYKVSKIYIAIPSAHAEDKRDIINICKETGCELKQLPGMYQLLTGQVTVSALREVAIEDLLGREPIKADMKEVFDFVNGKVVLVTGGGGSIGSELCRQVAAHCPKQLIIFDVYENNAYALQLELKHNYPNLK